MYSNPHHAVAWQAAGTTISTLLSLALLGLLARWLGVGLFGEYIGTLNTAIMLMMLMEAGWPTLIYQQTTEHASTDAKPKQTFAKALTHTSLLAAVIVLIYMALLNQASLAAAVACVWLMSVMNMISARMRGLGRFKQEAIWQVLGRACSMLAIVAVCVVWRSTLTHVFLAWAAGLALALLAMGRQWLVAPQVNGLIKTYPMLLPFLGYEWLMITLSKADVAFLQWFQLNPELLSYYAASSRLTEFGLLAFAPISNVLLKALNQRTSNPNAFNQLMRQALTMAWLFGLIAVVACWFGGGRIMELAFGAAFEDADQLLLLIAFALPFLLSNMAMAQGLIATNHVRKLAMRLLAGVVVLCLGMMYAAITQHAFSAAISLLIAHIVVFVLLLQHTLTHRRTVAPSHERHHEYLL